MSEITGITNSSDKDRDMMLRNAFEAGKDKDETAEKKKKKKSLFEPVKKETGESEEKKAPKQEAGVEKPFSFNFLGREVTIAKESESKNKEDAESSEAANDKLADNSPENMSENEAKAAVEKITEARIAELATELARTEENTVDKEALKNDLKFIKTVQQKAREEDVDIALDEAFNEVANEIGEGIESDFEAVLAANDLAQPGLEAEPENEPDVSAAGVTNPPPASPPPMPPGGGGRSSVSPAGMSPFGGVPSGPNVLPSSPNTVPQTPEVKYVRRGSRAGDLILGGAVGYMFGRRGGRIRTEARMGPIIESQERRLESLQEEISSKEGKIRELAVAKAEAVARLKQEAGPEQARGFLESAPAAETLSVDRPDVLVTPSTPELRPAKPEVFNPAAKTPERFGGSIEASQGSAKPETLKPFNQLTVPELLKIADNIEINGITAKEMYESRRLDIVNLRRVVGEYLRGNNYERTLIDQLKAEEGRRERSVEARPGQAAGLTNGAVAGGGTTTVSSGSTKWGGSPVLSAVPSNPAGLPSQPGAPQSFTGKSQAKPAPWLIVGVGLGLIIAALLIIL